jgi:phosphatidylserine/phosphatidylglycerophosphate/cardiolipin synthase-like enzyme
MIEALSELPTHLRKRLAAGLDAGLLSAPFSAAGVRATLGTGGAAEQVATALAELEQVGISGRGAAAWLRALDTAVSKAPRPDLVWSGPEVPGLHARDTRRVFEELLGTAVHTVWASTYAFFDGPKAFEVLSRRMDSQPDLRVNLLLNIQRKRGDTTAADHLVRQFADRFWKKDWPGERRPGVFYDPRALDLDGPSGVLHAKAVVVDDRTVFVTSANLTEAALDRNIELGMLVRDPAMALTVATHFRTLIEQQLLIALPAE